MGLVDNTCDGRRVAAVYDTSVNCNRLTPQFVLWWICGATCSDTCALDLDWHSASRGSVCGSRAFVEAWLGSRVVSVLDSGAVGPGFKSQSRRCLRQTVHTHRASVHQAAKLEVPANAGFRLYIMAVKRWSVVVVDHNIYQADTRQICRFGKSYACR